jgi:RNA polymerase sigma-70 factor, ECF subfamily
MRLPSWTRKQPWRMRGLAVPADRPSEYFLRQSTPADASDRMMANDSGDVPPGATEHDVTQLLEELRSGGDGAADRLAALVYHQLHRIASNALRGERPDHTLQPTELVDEAFVAMLGQTQLNWQNRSHFYAVASRVIRRILVDHARRRNAVKRDFGVQVTLDDSLRSDTSTSLDLIALDDALKELETLSPRQGRVVELRFFAGLDVEETAELLEISTATVKRDWAFARAFLLDALAS